MSLFKIIGNNQSEGEKLKEIRLLIKKGVKLDEKDCLGQTALLDACWRGYNEIIKELIKEGAKIELKDDHGKTALMRACNQPDLTKIKGTMKLLIKKGAPLEEITGQNGSTAIITSSFYGYEEAIKVLIKAGARINKANEFGETALMLAASAFKGHKETVKLLIKKGANISLKNNYGETAFMYAVFYGHEEIVKLLIEAGAKLNNKNKEGKTALMIASQRGYKGIVKLLKEAESITKKIKVSSLKGMILNTLNENEIKFPKNYPRSFKRRPTLAEESETFSNNKRKFIK